MNSTLPFFVQRFVDASGKPLSGGKLYFYVAGATSLPKHVYVDHENTLPVSQPVVLDANGVAPQYFAEDGMYYIELRDAAGALILTRDYVQGNGGGGTPTVDDHKVAVDALDATPGFLSDKLVSSNTTTAVEVVGAERVMQIETKGFAAVNASDTQGYLDSKIVSSPSVSFTSTNIGTVGSPNYVLTAVVNTNYGQATPVWSILKTTDPATAPFGLAQTDLEQIWRHGYGVASSMTQTSEPVPNSDLSIWYLEGGTYYGDATWVEKHYKLGHLIVNANKGVYDFMTTLPATPNTDYSNYPAGLYVLASDGADGFVWQGQLVKQYPDPAYSTDSVLTYNGTTKAFAWTAQSSFSGDGSVRIDTSDSYGYLGYKIQAGAGISVTDTFNGAFGRYLSLAVTGSNPSGNTYASTMYVANATSTLAPNLIVRSELITLFVPTTDITVIQGIRSKFGCFLAQGGTGTMRFTLRDDQYRLIAISYDTTNPSPAVFLELDCGIVYDPATGLSVPTYTLTCGGRYYLGINWNANGIQICGDDAVQNTNTQPYPAYKVDNLTSVPAQLTGGGESKQRPFIRLLTRP
jgi:hypothetical protein